MHSRYVWRFSQLLILVLILCGHTCLKVKVRDQSCWGSVLLGHSLPPGVRKVVCEGGRPKMLLMHSLQFSFARFKLKDLFNYFDLSWYQKYILREEYDAFLMIRGFTSDWICSLKLKILYEGQVGEEGYSSVGPLLCTGLSENYFFYWIKSTCLRTVSEK